LHPKWQLRVVEDLRSLFPNVQFIATSHSPFIIQTMREGEVIDLDDKVIPSLANKGIEAIAEDVMGVEDPEVSPRYREMVEIAKTYLDDVDEAVRSPIENHELFLEKMAQRLAPYADNPAFQAFLEMERVAKLGF